MARRAMDCVLRGDGVGPTDTVTGSTLELFIQTLHHDKGEAMSGNESVSVRISAPSGVVLPAPLAFLQGRFKVHRNLLHSPQGDLEQQALLRTASVTICGLGDVLRFDVEMRRAIGPQYLARLTDTKLDVYRAGCTPIMYRSGVVAIRTSLVNRSAL